MDVHPRTRTATLAVCLTSFLAASPAALAGPAENAIQACKAAIADEQQISDLSARLKRIKTRGNTYETWFNLVNGQERFKAYCVTRRAEVQEVFVAEGQWTGRNPGAPEPSAAS